MYIIVGLGNPGEKYNHTRHNIGFEAVDYIAKENDILFVEKKKKAFIGKGYIQGKRVVLAKPQTYMNLSGDSVRELVDFYKVDAKTQLIILYDDVSLPIGKLRIRKSGTAGGHNGIKSIITNLGNIDFYRIKIGVGKKPTHYDLADYVLGHFDKKEQEYMKECLSDISAAVELMVQDELEKAMNTYNRKKIVESIEE